MTLLAVYQATQQHAPIAAGLFAPAAIMFLYVFWVLYTASRKRRRDAQMRQLEVRSFPRLCRAVRYLCVCVCVTRFVFLRRRKLMLNPEEANMYLSGSKLIFLPTITRGNSVVLTRSPDSFNGRLRQTFHVLFLYSSFVVRNKRYLYRVVFCS